MDPCGYTKGKKRKEPRVLVVGWHADQYDMCWMSG